MDEPECSCDYVDIGHRLTVRVYSEECPAHGPDDEPETVKESYDELTSSAWGMPRWYM